ncbi:probable protein phosphatase 2C 12 isoform X2 [Phoenix dactylifera]|uniref:protein-serine/threonine phosphatase n=1 Tax=Phoenix dactylifera TaxID=42345 RepID=A0A8B7MUZ3_PHODC|nr:probable protein phosphatase 2C 12 isoform X2 [Phoenix dactylifera]
MAAKAAGNQTVPLAVLLKRELTSEKIEKPDILHGQASQSKKGEDFTLLKSDCQRIPGDGVTTFSVFALFDGHNGSAAAIYAKENLLNNILCAIPSDLSRDEWLAALPRALVAGFVKTDKDFQTKAHTSGTTVTFVIIDEWVVTVASVGDSRCILESAEGSIYYMSADHRLEANEEEVERITASGGEVGRLNVVGGAELSNAGARLIISSDGVWDALTSEAALNCSRGLPADVAANQIVKEAVQVKGLRDDTTCIVVDILPPEKVTPAVPSQKRQGMGVFKNMFRRRSCESTSHSDRGYSQPDVVEEIFEEGSAMLAKRKLQQTLVVLNCCRGASMNPENPLGKQESYLVHSNTISCNQEGIGYKLKSNVSRTGTGHRTSCSAGRVSTGPCRAVPSLHRHSARGGVEGERERKRERRRREGGRLAATVAGAAGEGSFSLFPSLLPPAMVFVFVAGTVPVSSRDGSEWPEPPGSGRFRRPCSRVKLILSPIYLL